MASFSMECDDEADSPFYDFLLVGKTGLGKSTTANKLLGVDPANQSLINPRVGEDVGNIIAVIQVWGDKEKRYFVVGEGIHSVTTECELLSNTRNLNRVLDTPGFADSKLTSQYGLRKSNLQVFRWIVRAQKTHNLHFSRVLYFLPNRGPLERADGALQEEIKVMYEFFGLKIFDIMVIIATQHKKYQKTPFDDDDKDRTTLVFKEAFEQITGQYLDRCPPVVYLAMDAENVDNTIIGAPVLMEEELEPLEEGYQVSGEEEEKRKEEGRSGGGRDGESETDDITKRKPRFSFSRRFQGRTETRKQTRHFQFQDICSRCAVQMVYKTKPNGQRVPVKVVEENGKQKLLKESKCHPIFIPKHSVLVKLAGGMAHVVTLGMFAAAGKILGQSVWPGFTNADEECPVCGGPPGSDGCSVVGKKVRWEVKGKRKKEKVSMVTEHIVSLDVISIESE